MTGSAARRDEIVVLTGAGGIGTPDDVAAVVEFLVSPGAAFITGTDVLVDGGVVAAMRHSRSSDE